MKSARPSPLQEFIEAYAHALGGLAEVNPQGDMDLLDPVSGRLRLLLFDPEGVAESPEGELVAPGSAVLEELLGYARQRGRVSRARLGVPLPPGHRAAASVLQALRVPEARVVAKELRWIEAEYAVFLFRASFVSDLREEELIQVVLDRSTGRLVRRWEEILKAGSLQEGVLHADALTGLPLSTAYEAARSEILRNLSSLVTQRHQSLREWQRREMLRVSQYHEQLSEELTERANNEKDEAKRAALLARIQANQTEAQRAFQDLEAKYTLSLDLECVSLLLVQAPKAIAVCEVEMPKRHWKAGIEVMWNAATQMPEPPDCPSCGRPEFRMILWRDGLVCLACSERLRT